MLLILSPWFPTWRIPSPVSRRSSSFLPSSRWPSKMFSALFCCTLSKASNWSSVIYIKSATSIIMPKSCRWHVAPIPLIFIALRNKVKPSLLSIEQDILDSSNESLPLLPNVLIFMTDRASCWKLVGLLVSGRFSKITRCDFGIMSLLYELQPCLLDECRVL